MQYPTGPASTSRLKRLRRETAGFRVRPDVVGHALTSDDFPRHREVLAYLKDHGLEKEPWIALEDDLAAYLPGAPVILTDPERGFDESIAAELMKLG